MDYGVNKYLTLFVMHTLIDSIKTLCCEEELVV